MKKGQIYEGTIESVDFPNKGNIYLDGEKQHVVVKNGIPGQKVRFAVRKWQRPGEPSGGAGEVAPGDKGAGLQPVSGLRRVHVPDHVL